MGKHVVCHSGGHSSALVAVEVVRRYGKENVVLVNHDLPFWTEHADIKRFKVEVARREGDRWFTRGANHCRGTLQGVAYWARLQPLPPEILRRIQRAAPPKELTP
ncbi:hypothetical protein [Achromobacter sp. 413638]|uniref:hypothetical protein n=1 Tax=Achromobacter sp. 413638 TaxID=3342385 RepID=UPI00370BC4E8